MTFFEKLISTQASSAVILIRLMVGSVFLVEGIQKFLFPGEVGAGRFARIGIPNPEMMGPFVGAVETVCGTLVLMGLFTRLAVVPLIIIMLVAIVATKVPILIGEGFWGFSLRKVPYYGFWGMAHEARTDWSMLLGSTFLFVVGGGSLSLDAILSKRRGTR
ncbi:MAG TPA: DoxX family protein [Pyrinomonadaceae bacterium]|nr:DoxX family protein [Pyrinomonadaceae bacterium]